MNSRRTFLAQSAAALAGAYFAQSQAFAQSTSSYTYFDLHTHPGMFLAKDAAPGIDEAVAKTIGEMNQGGLTGAFFSMVADAPVIKTGNNGIGMNGNYQPGEAWKEYKRQLSILKEYIQSLPVTAAFKGS